ncbi:hatching enzyme 1.2-like isoform X2 [Paramacrobiotus metropolitanus]|nr:hatching enzyme 1.2-like isoform X2 [Paramacrobiotus metropolitanus]
MLSAPDIFEGDILGYTPGIKVPQETEKVANNFVKNDDLRWPGGVVPYMLSRQFRPIDKQSVRNALQIFQAKTPIIFREKTDADKDFVYIGPSFGCSSYVGRQKGQQTLALQVPGCMGPGYVHHELMHAIGFFHEQSRTDRDQYVDINWDNIEKGQNLQFQRYTDKEITAFGKPYDFGSILHYGMYDFARKKDTWTIRPKDGPQYEENAAKMGQRKELSQTDIEKIQLAYGKPSDDTTCLTTQGWVTFQNSCYYFSFLAEPPLKKTFSRARTFCREKNAKISRTPRNRIEEFFSSQLSSDAADLDDDERVYVSNCNTITRSNVHKPGESDCDESLYFVCSKRISRLSE